MSFSRCVAVLSLLITGHFALAQGARPAADEVYKGAIIMEVATGRVLLEDNADLVGPPASIAKLMTFLVVHDAIRAGALTLQTPVTVTAADSKIGGTQVWLKQGETFPVEELLYALMIQSANDAAHALARTTAGTVPAFVERMNARGRALGMTNTTFRTPHGLPPANRRITDGDLTTPRDLARLSRHLLAETNILKYTSVKFRAFRDGQPTGRIEMRNHNHLLERVAGVDGLKTGYTAGAGFCLAATAQRDGKRIVAVIMGSADRKTRDLKMAELIERGFADTRLTTTASDPSPVAHAPLAPADRTPPSGGGGDAPVIKFSIPGR